VSPARRRRAVAMLRDRLDVSERWACRVVGQHRSTERYEPKRAEDDAALRAALRKFAADRPRWGYRRAHHRLRQDGWSVNRKRVQRLWLECPRFRGHLRALVERPGQEVRSASNQTAVSGGVQA
jgi:putative transposase